MSDPNQPADRPPLPSGGGTPPRVEYKRPHRSALLSPPPDHGVLPVTGKLIVVRIDSGGRTPNADLDGATYWRLKEPLPAGIIPPRFRPRTLHQLVGHYERSILYRTRDEESRDVRYLAHTVFGNFLISSFEYEPAVGFWTELNLDQALDALIDSSYTETLPHDLQLLLKARLSPPGAEQAPSPGSAARLGTKKAGVMASRWSTPVRDLFTLDEWIAFREHAERVDGYYAVCEAEEGRIRELDRARVEELQAELRKYDPARINGGMTDAASLVVNPEHIHRELKAIYDRQKEQLEEFTRSHRPKIDPLDSPTRLVAGIDAEMVHLDATELNDRHAQQVGMTKVSSRDHESEARRAYREVRGRALKLAKNVPSLRDNLPLHSDPIEGLLEIRRLFDRIQVELAERPPSPWLLGLIRALDQIINLAHEINECATLPGYPLESREMTLRFFIGTQLGDQLSLYKDGPCADDLEAIRWAEDLIERTMEGYRRFHDPVHQAERPWPTWRLDEAEIRAFEVIRDRIAGKWARGASEATLRTAPLARPTRAEISGPAPSPLATPEATDADEIEADNPPAPDSGDPGGDPQREPPLDQQDGEWIPMKEAWEAATKRGVKIGFSGFYKTWEKSGLEIRGTSGSGKGRTRSKVRKTDLGNWILERLDKDRSG